MGVVSPCGARSLDTPTMATSAGETPQRRPRPIKERFDAAVSMVQSLPKEGERENHRRPFLVVGSVDVV